MIKGQTVLRKLHQKDEEEKNGEECSRLCLLGVIALQSQVKNINIFFLPSSNLFIKANTFLDCWELYAFPNL